MRWLKTACRAALWDEVKDRLSESAHGMSEGQQQRLCIARARRQAKILLMDEPCRLDHRHRQGRGLIHELKKEYTMSS